MYQALGWEMDQWKIEKCADVVDELNVFKFLFEFYC